jgi:predicted DNA-binding transcriptional regulator AlpA
MADRVIPEGARFLSPTSASSKVDRGRSWIWDRLRRDPTFPKPVYLDDKAPLFIEAELDAWVAARAARRQSAEAAT